MKRVIMSALLLAFTVSANVLFAQDSPDMKDKTKEKNKESQEIIIRKKGDKDVTVTVEIKGDKILVNGKPLAEFKDDNIIINNRKMFMRDGDGNMTFNLNTDMMPMKIRGFGGSNDSSFWKVGKGEKRAFLGVSTEKANDDEGDGAKISNVTEESGAAKAGLKEGDIITKVDGKKIENPSDLTEAIRSKKINDQVNISYKREGKEKSTKATLGETTDNAMAYSFSGPGMEKLKELGNIRGSGNFNDMMPQFGNSDWNTNNFSGNIMNFSRRPKIGLKIQDVEEGSGVKIIDADKDSPAEKAGLKKDDIITEINGKKVNNTDEAREQLKPEEGKNSFSIKIKRNGSDMNIEVKIPKKLKTADL
ncbi:MAG: PDZ domain-containing protein [Ferruginibacter sp.]